VGRSPTEHQKALKYDFSTTCSTSATRTVLCVEPKAHLGTTQAWMLHWMECYSAVYCRKETQMQGDWGALKYGSCSA